MHDPWPIWVNANMPDGTPIWEWQTGTEFWPSIVPDMGVTICLCTQCRRVYKGAHCPIHGGAQGESEAAGDE